MTRLFILALALGCFTIVGCGPSNEAVFEESEAPTEAEQAAADEYTESLEGTSDPSNYESGKDPFAADLNKTYPDE